MWWFILISIGLVYFGWLIADFIFGFALIAFIFGLFGNDRFSNILGAFLIILYFPPLFCVLAFGTDVWWSVSCNTGHSDSCTYNTIFLPGLHPDTPTIWTLNGYTPKELAQKQIEDEAAARARFINSQ